MIIEKGKTVTVMSDVVLFKKITHSFDSGRYFFMEIIIIIKIIKDIM